MQSRTKVLRERTLRVGPPGATDFRLQGSGREKPFERVDSWMIALVCLAIAAGRWGETEHVAFTLPRASRVHATALGMVGPFTDEVPVCIDWRAAGSFRELFWLMRASLCASELDAYPGLSVLRFGSDRLPRAPRCHFASSLGALRDLSSSESAPARVVCGDLQLGVYALDDEVIPDPERSRPRRYAYKLSMTLGVGGELLLTLSIDSMQVDGRFIREHLDDYARILQVAVTDPSAHIRNAREDRAI